MKKIKKKHNPKSGRLAVGGNWKDAVKKALKLGKPPEGWPDKKKP